MKLWKKIAAAAVIGASLIVLWKIVLVPWREDRHWLYAARTSLKTLAELEQTYCFYSGRYTDDLLKLATMAPEPGKIAGMMEEAFLPGSFRIEAARDHARLSASARDRNKTPFSFEVRKPQK